MRELVYKSGKKCRCKPFQRQDQQEKSHSNQSAPADVEGFIDEKAKVIGTNLLIIDTLNEEENILYRFINLMKK